tara:strand:- start:3431 stop:3769 length:339 start_codon:yes stop_codon:yes gene_type:complete
VGKIELKRIFKGFCPNCGKDKLFFKWARMKRSCSKCGISFIEQNGDNWFFLLFIDRGLFIFPIIVSFYFEMEPRLLILFSLVLMILFIIATPFRLCACLALEFFLRTKFRNN